MIDVLKIDIEGSEKEVFEDTDARLAKVQMLIIETHEDMRQGSHEIVMKTMRNYKNYRLGENIIFTKNP